MLVNKAHSADSHTRSVEKPSLGGRGQSHSMFLQPQGIRMSGVQSGSSDDSIASRQHGGHESYDKEDQVPSAVQEPSARVGRETQALTSLEPTTTTETPTDQQNQTTSPPSNADKAAAPIDGGGEPLRAEAVTVSVSIADPVNQEDRNDLGDMKILRKLQDHKKERDGRKRWIQIYREGRPDIESLKENQQKAEAEAAEKARIAEQARLASEAARKELDDALANEHRVVVQEQKLLELAEESKRLRVQLGIEDDLGEWIAKKEFNHRKVLLHCIMDRIVPQSEHCTGHHVAHMFALFPEVRLDLLYGMPNFITSFECLRAFVLLSVLQTRPRTSTGQPWWFSKIGQRLSSEDGTIASSAYAQSSSKSQIGNSYFTNSPAIRSMTLPSLKGHGTCGVGGRYHVLRSQSKCLYRQRVYAVGHAQPVMLHSFAA